MKFQGHYLGLAFAIALGTILRFWNLGFKPLWLDEVITALMSLGRSYNDVPLEVLFPLNTIQQIFTLNPEATCPQIAHTLATQSTHPPLFFCLLHRWLELVGTRYPSLSTALRSLPALFGVGAIAALYCLNRIAFSKPAGLMAAALMAVSPFGVYLSQEARHYTLPILLITLALLGLIQIQQDLQRQQFRPLVWLGWVAVNSIGFYVHYFVILAFLAQTATLAIGIYKLKILVIKDKYIPIKEGLFTIIKSKEKRSLFKKIIPLSPFLLLFSCLLPFICFLPWIPVLLNNASRPETSWIPQPNNIGPLYQTLFTGWLPMVVIFPVEDQPIWISVLSGLLMLSFGIWLGWYVIKGLKQLWQSPSTHLETLTLGTFTLCLLLEFFAIVYLLDKDLTVAPRYHFIYYPAICALVGASLVSKSPKKQANRELETGIKHHSPLPLCPSAPLPLATLCVGLISCLFVVYGLAFQKPYNPQQVAQDMNVDSAVPLMVVVGYNDYQDVALGLSFGLALDKVRTPIKAAETPDSYLAFFKRSPGYEPVWQNLSQIAPPASKLNLWMVAPGLRRRDFPPQLSLANPMTCKLDPDGHHRIGIPYQLYRCNG